MDIIQGRGSILYHTYQANKSFIYIYRMMNMHLRERRESEKYSIMSEVYIIHQCIHSYVLKKKRKNAGEMNV